MKKLAITLCLACSFIGSSFAYYNENETSNIDTLKAQGFSDSTIHIVDTSVKFSQGKNSKRNSQSTRKKNKNIFSKGYTKVKNYFDPYQDDAQFGEHQIEYSNRWNWSSDTPKYIEKYNTGYSTENL